MFRWYKNAELCYVYLSDLVGWEDGVQDGEDHPNRDEAMRLRLGQCRWFTRGWTLQELIAPRHVQFHASDWREIGNKVDLHRVVSAITRIDKDILLGGNLSNVSVARRMSWASDRKTSRIEDAAYCLLGIFDVNLPLIYGEGPKAFRRLQEAIMVSTHDQSLFAWGRFVDSPSDVFDQDPDTALDLRTLPWKPFDQRPRRLGLFADSPLDFRASHNIRPVDHQYAHALYRYRAPSIVSGGVMTNMVIRRRLPSVAYLDDPELAYKEEAELAFLLCRVGGGTGVNGGKLIGIVIRPCGDDYYSRTDELVPVDDFVSFYRFQNWTRPRHFLPWPEFRLRHGDIFLRRWHSQFKETDDWRAFISSGPSWRRACLNRVLRPQDGARGDEYFCITHELNASKEVGITLKRALCGPPRPFSSSSSSSSPPRPLGNLLVGASIINDHQAAITEDNLHGPRGIVDSRRGGGNPDRSDGGGSDCRFRVSPPYSHVMAIPSDTWELERDHLPRIYAKVQRMTLTGGEDGGEVDIVDLFMLWDGPLTEHIKRALPDL